MSKTIAIIGAFSVPNFGDQLLVQVFIDNLNAIDEDFSYIIPFIGDKVERLPSVNYGGGFDSLIKADYVIFAGGGFLGETPNDKGSLSSYSHVLDRNANFALFKLFGLNKYLGRGRPLRKSTLSFFNYYKISEFCRKHGIPTFVMGTGLGPVTTIPGRFFVKNILNNAKLIYLRDKESVQYANKLKINKHVNMTSDIVLSLSKIVDVKSFKEFNNIGLHLGQITGTAQIEAIEFLCEYLKSEGFKVCVLMDNFDEVEVTVSKNISEKFNFEFIDYPNNVDGFILNYSQLDAIITTKLHTGILAYSYGVLPLSLPAHPKSKRLYNQIGLQDLCTSLDHQGAQATIDNIRELRKVNFNDLSNLLNSKRELVLDLNKKMIHAFNEFINQNGRV